MSDEVLKRDGNFVTVLGGITDDSNQYVTMLRVDPTTKRLKVSASLPAGVGTVTSVSVVSANGFAGTVATATTTPAITLSTTITGILQGNGTAISAITIGTGLSFAGGTLSATGDLSVTLLDVSANSTTAPNSIYNLSSDIPVIFKSSDANTMLYLDETNERIGVGTTPATKLHVLATTEQLRLGYDGSNYLSVTVASAGSTTFALTGTSPVFTFSQAATIATSVTVPLIIGGSGTTQTLTYKTTTGVGTTNSDHIFQSGNNGATEIMRACFNGELRIGQTTSSSSRLTVVNTAQTSGTLSLFSAIQSAPNSSDTGDGALTLSYSLSASSATNQLVGRILNFITDNSLTGGGAITNLRCFNMSVSTQTGTTITNLSNIYIESGTTNGTVTTGYGINIASLQGTTKYGVYDAVGTKWVNANGGVLGIGTTNPGVIGQFGDTASAGQNTIKVIGGVTGVGGADKAPVYSFFRSSVAEWTMSISEGASVGDFSIGPNPSSYTDANLQAASTFSLTTAGSVILGHKAALATNATDGFTYIPTSAGTPTGAPTAYTGKVAMEYDTSNNKLYVYNGAWKSVTLA